MSLIGARFSLLRRGFQIGAALLVVGAIVVGPAVPGRAEAAGAVIVEPSLDPRSWTYGPDPLVIRAGEAVTWTNTGVAPHTVTAYDGSFDSGIMAGGAAWSLTPATPGVYGYYCTLHEWMVGTLVAA